MPTINLGLPLLTGNMNADVVRDVNALAEGVDVKVGKSNGLATLGADGKVPSSQLNIDTSTLATKQELTTHKADNTAHGMNLKANKIQENWILATLQNGWINNTGVRAKASYYKDELGTVHLKGMVTSGTAGLGIFTLPVGYRPKEYLDFWVNSGATQGKAVILPNGEVNMSSGNNAGFSLDHISFRAEQ